MRNWVINYSATVVSGVVGLALVPIMLHALGRENYGVWILGGTLAASLRFLDLGAGWSVTREVARINTYVCQQELSRFVQTAGNLYLLLSSVGAALMLSLGFPLIVGLHLSPDLDMRARWTFLLLAVAFVSDQMVAYLMAILQGLRRFDLTNTLSIGIIIVRAIGIGLLLRNGQGLLSISLLHAAVSLVGLLACSSIVSWLNPQLRPKWGVLDWELVRRHVPFGLTSLLLDAAMIGIWNAPRLFIGAVLGAPAVTNFHIAQRFPQAVGQLTIRGAEVLYPAASEHVQTQDPVAQRRDLEVGTRWALMSVLPATLVLITLASPLLRAWVGNVQDEMIVVLRLTAAVILADALGAPAAQVLWGRGVMKKTLLIFGSMAIGTLVIGGPLLLRFGIAGAAAALVIPVTIGSFALLYCAGETCSASPLHLLNYCLEGLYVPTALCVGSVVLVMNVLPNNGWSEIGVASLTGAIVYLTALFMLGARNEERRLMINFLRFLPGVASSVATSIRRSFFGLGD